MPNIIFSISTGSKFLAHVKVDDKQTHTGQNRMLSTPTLSDDHLYMNGAGSADPRVHTQILWGNSSTFQALHMKIQAFKNV